MTSITTAIRADAATSDAEGRAQAAEMVTALTIGALAETVTRLNASEDRALRLEVQRDELLAQVERIDDMQRHVQSRGDLLLVHAGSDPGFPETGAASLRITRDVRIGLVHHFGPSPVCAFAACGNSTLSRC